MCDGLELIYDDESGTWSEAPETYGSIAFDTQEAFEEALDILKNSKWISCKDKMPEPEKEVLVWYRYTWGAGFTSYRFGISKWFSNRKRWYEGCLPKDIEVLYWQPLPEPPKDGDTNG